MADVTEVAGGSLGSMNAGVGLAVGFVGPLSAQLDAMIAQGLGPLQADLSTNLSANLGIQASLSLAAVGDPTAGLRAALAAVAQIQAAITAQLTLPSLSTDASLQLSTNAALAAVLTAKLGLIRGLIQATLAVKFPAVEAGAQLAAALSAGPAIAATFDGLSDGTTLAEIGTLIDAKFAAGLSYGGETINPSDPVSGVVLVTSATSAFNALGFILFGD